MPRHLLASAVAAVVLVAGSLFLLWTPSPGAPAHGSASSSDEFEVAGDGTLPEKRPPLREQGAPLSTAERGYAIGLALASLPDSGRDVLDEARAEVLAADLPAVDLRDGRRRVQVTAYDYDDDRLHQILLDLPTGRVISEEALTGVQPPPSTAETQVALDLALTAMPAPAFVDQFRQLTGAPLLAADEVRVIGAAWAPEDGGGSSATRTCGTERCVQLLVALPSGQYLSTDDFVVNLSRRAVTLFPPGGHRHG
ncbi:hypothetical protein KVF89_28425 [Nocardioides carbamazepini]|uniref:hypothetical protein n=1 Tax=Nocardioides carbamazepini TaxID=2854259 RepID=UPI002149ED65|nr:hypothetical protein [Nocardioides carbamazepini]MCR1786494.1 hypothetical protein [Nocardioides carbamazepini]